MAQVSSPVLVKKKKKPLLAGKNNVGHTEQYRTAYVVLLYKHLCKTCVTSCKLTTVVISKAVQLFDRFPLVGLSCTSLSIAVSLDALFLLHEVCVSFPARIENFFSKTVL